MLFCSRDRNCKHTTWNTTGVAERQKQKQKQQWSRSHSNCNKTVLLVCELRLCGVPCARLSHTCVNNIVVVSLAQPAQQHKASQRCPNSTATSPNHQPQPTLIEPVLLTRWSCDSPVLRCCRVSAGLPSALNTSLLSLCAAINCCTQGCCGVLIQGRKGGRRGVRILEGTPQ